ncbi:guanylate kinase [Chloroflexota bacterium]
MKVPVKPLLILLSGPSGAGKDALVNRLRGIDYPLKCITTVTTRPPRPNEKDGVDYYFTSMERFQEMTKMGELLERANVYGNWYGVPKEPAKKALDKGQDIIIKVDVQGAVTIKKLIPQAVFVFLMPPSVEKLRARLRKRHTESPTELDLRLKMAEEEIEQLSLFDYIVVNKCEEIDRAVAEIKAIIVAEKCRVIPREITL